MSAVDPFLEWYSDDGWEYVNAASGTTLSENLAPAVAFRFRVKMNLMHKIPDFGGVGSWSSTSWLAYANASWRLKLTNPNYDGSGGDSDWAEGDALAGYDPDGGGVFFDGTGSGLWRIDGIYSGLQALNLTWRYGVDAVSIDRPLNAIMVSSWGSDTISSGAEALGEVFQPSGSVMYPAQGTAFVAGDYWLGATVNEVGQTWTSPIILAPIGDPCEWDLSFSTSFDDHWYALLMQRISLGSGMADLDRDSILHGMRLQTPVLIFTENVGGKRGWVARRSSQIASTWGCLVHLDDGSLMVLGLKGKSCYLFRSRDGGIHWDAPILVEGSGIPMSMRLGNDGELHALVFSGSATVYKLLTRSGDVRQSKTVHTLAALTSDIVPLRDGKLLVRSVVGSNEKFWESRVGGRSWKLVT